MLGFGVVVESLLGTFTIHIRMPGSSPAVLVPLLLIQLSAKAHSEGQLVMAQVFPYRELKWHSEFQDLA